MRSEVRRPQLPGILGDDASDDGLSLGLQEGPKSAGSLLWLRESRLALSRCCFRFCGLGMWDVQLPGQR